MKKYILGIAFITTILGITALSYVNAQPAGVSSPSFSDYNNGAGGFGVNTTTVNDLNTIGTNADQGGGLINVAKNFINRVLGILSLIVLIIVLIGGFQMVTAAGNDSRYKKGFTLMKQAGIGLVVIGLAWFIVSIVFRILRGSAAVGSTTTPTP